MIEYLGEYIPFCGKALTMAQIELFDEKKPEVKNIVTGSL
jgi:hypothetical protein